MHEANHDGTEATVDGVLIDLRAEIRQLAGRLDTLESQMVGDRALHRRVAELADVVEQLLLASDCERDSGFVSRVRRYVKSL